jgi:hypothetical protein
MILENPFYELARVRHGELVRRNNIEHKLSEIDSLPVVS